MAEADRGRGGGDWVNARFVTAGRSDPAREPRDMRAGGARRECWPRTEEVAD